MNFNFYDCFSSSDSIDESRHTDAMDVDTLSDESLDGQDA